MGVTSITTGSPDVSVPVLSNAIACKCAGTSMYKPPLINTPLRAAAANAATMLMGVEMTKAHGQAMTSSTNDRYSQSDQIPPNSNGGITKTPTATAITMGVYTRANRSTHFSNGARRDCVSATM